MKPDTASPAPVAVRWRWLSTMLCIPLFSMFALAAPKEVAPVAAGARQPTTTERRAATPERRLATPTDKAYRVKGFRSAHFGDNEAKVRAAITGDFSLPSSRVQRYTHPLQRTLVLKIELKKLEPSESPATVSYVFGHKSRTLIQVDILWQARASSREAVEQLTSVGTLLAAHFEGYTWKKDSVRQLALLSDNTIAVYQAHDRQTGAVRLLLGGVRVSKEPDSKKKPTSDAQKEVQLLRLEAEDEAGQRGVYTVDAPLGKDKSLSLLLSYIANRDQADVYQLSKGDF